MRSRSAWWYVSPILLGCIGGLAAFLTLYRDDPEKARNCFIIGVIVTVIWLLPNALLSAWLYFDLVTVTVLIAILIGIILIVVILNSANAATPVRPKEDTNKHQKTSSNRDNNKTYNKNSADSKDYDHYAVLGLSKSASSPEIRNRYHDLVENYHKNGGDDSMLARINKAYEILSDPELRYRYNYATAERNAKTDEGHNDDEVGSHNGGHGGNDRTYEDTHNNHNYEDYDNDKSYDDDDDDDKDYDDKDYDDKDYDDKDYDDKDYDDKDYDDKDYDDKDYDDKDYDDKDYDDKDYDDKDYDYDDVDEDDDDYYAILGIKRNASMHVIKKRFRELVKKHHPDRSGGDGLELVRINKAYEILSDPILRRRYDASLTRNTSGAPF